MMTLLADAHLDDALAEERVLGHQPQGILQLELIGRVVQRFLEIRGAGPQGSWPPREPAAGPPTNCCV